MKKLFLFTLYRGSPLRPFLDFEAHAEDEFVATIMSFLYCERYHAAGATVTEIN